MPWRYSKITLRKYREELRSCALHVGTVTCFEDHLLGLKVYLSQHVPLQAQPRIFGGFNMAQYLSLPFLVLFIMINIIGAIGLPLDRTLMDGASWVIFADVCYLRLEPSLKPNRRLSFLLAERTRHDSATVLLCIWMASQIVFNCRFNPILQSQCAKCLRKSFFPNCKLCSWPVIWSMLEMVHSQLSPLSDDCATSHGWNCVESQCDT